MSNCGAGLKIRRLKNKNKYVWGICIYLFAPTFNGQIYDWREKAAEFVEGITTIEAGIDACHTGNAEGGGGGVFAAQQRLPISVPAELKFNFHHFYIKNLSVYSWFFVIFLLDLLIF